MSRVIVTIIALLALSACGAAEGDLSDMQNDENRVERDVEKLVSDCENANGTVVTVGNQSTCIVDGVNVGEWAP